MAMPKWLKGLNSRLSIIKRLYRFLWEQRLWWMIPMVSVLLLLGLLLFVGMQTPMGPFIYTLF
jgi:hypothetical protein